MKILQKNEVIDILTYNIAHIRKANNISKKKMAEILEIGIYSLNKIEKGILPPRLGVTILFRIQEYFNISIKAQLDEKIKKGDS